MVIIKCLNSKVNLQTPLIDKNNVWISLSSRCVTLLSQYRLIVQLVDSQLNITNGNKNKHTKLVKKKKKKFHFHSIFNWYEVRKMSATHLNDFLLQLISTVKIFFFFYFFNPENFI